MTGLPSRVLKPCCWTPDFCFEEVCAKSNPPMAAVKTRAHAKISRLGIMAKSVLRDRQFVMCVKRARSRQSATRFEFISTSVAKIALAQVNPFHRVRRSHHALIVLAMTQCERMPKFMNGFLQ